MRRVAILALLFSAVASAAQALTVRDVIELSRAGLGEDVLLAVIEVDGGVFTIDPATLKSLKDAGVSERVIVALVRSGRGRQAPEPPPAVIREEEPPPPPQVVVIDHPQPQVQPVLVPVPVYVTAPVTHVRRHDYIYTTPVENTYVPFQSGMPAVRPTQPQPAVPVYWGHGGKLRPDAWGQRPDRDGDKNEKADGRGRDRDRK